MNKCAYLLQVANTQKLMHRHSMQTYAHMHAHSQVDNTQNFMHRHRVHKDTSSHITVNTYPEP